MINNTCKDIINLFGVNKFIETGILEGETLSIVISWFCELYGDVFNTGPHNMGERGKYNIYEIDVNQLAIDAAFRRSQNNKNVIITKENSPDWLKKSIDNNEFNTDDSCLFYLDAHCGNLGENEPLRNEISQIKKLEKSIISIDDWHVPGYYPDIYDVNQIKDLIIDKTSYIHYIDTPNFHHKRSCLIFLGYDDNKVIELIKDLKITNEKL